MIPAALGPVDSKLDLVLERYVDVRPELVWRCWTEPQHVVKWFTPAPWQTVDCEIDLRPGGIFRTTMRSPEGQEFPHIGCYLDIVPRERLVWTSALGPGFRPAPPAPLHLTAIITLVPTGAGTTYIARALHMDQAAVKQHEEMGFHHGWGKALEQLVVVARQL